MNNPFELSENSFLNNIGFSSKNNFQKEGYNQQVPFIKKGFISKSPLS